MNIILMVKKKHRAELNCDFKLIFCHKYMSEHLSYFSEVVSILERQGSFVTTDFFF